MFKLNNIILTFLLFTACNNNAEIAPNKEEAELAFIKLQHTINVNIKRLNQPEVLKIYTQFSSLQEMKESITPNDLNWIALQLKSESSLLNTIFKNKTKEQLRQIKLNYFLKLSNVTENKQSAIGCDDCLIRSHEVWFDLFMVHQIEHGMNMEEANRFATIGASWYYIGCIENC